MQTAIQTSSNALTSQRQFTAEEAKLLQNTIAKDHTDDEIKLFIAFCQSKNLDPFSNEVFSIKRDDKLTFQIGIGGLRSRAESTGKYNGQETFWCGDDGKWVDVWLKDVPPVACKAVIYRRGADKPFTAIALWKEYKPAQNDFMWRKMPSNQLAKCAESLALKKAFPRNVGGLYTTDEMAQADKPLNRAVNMPIEKPIEIPKEVQTEAMLHAMANEDNTDPQDDNPFPGVEPEGADVPSEALFKHFRATLREQGVAEKVKQWCVTAYDKTSSKELTATQINAILDMIKKGAIKA